MTDIDWSSEKEVNDLIRTALLLANQTREPLVHEEYEYSERYQRWARKFLADPFGYAKKVRRPTWRKALNKVAIFFLAVAITFAALMMNPDVRAAVKKWYIETFITHDSYFFTGESEPQTEADWQPTYLPEGYVEVEQTEVGRRVIRRFENALGEGISLRYQPMGEGGAFSVDNEQMEVTETTINGNAAITYQAMVPDKQNMVLWINEDKNTAFLLMSYEPCDTLTRIAEGIELPD